QNQNVRAKIRQQLQILRDLGLLDFISPGEYSVRN
ncbi:MAG: restriction endonuclease, partial [Acidobacteria bacterium]